MTKMHISLLGMSAKDMLADSKWSSAELRSIPTGHVSRSDISSQDGNSLCSHIPSSAVRFTPPISFNPLAVLEGGKR